MLNPSLSFVLAVRQYLSQWWTWFIHVRFGNCRPGSSRIRVIFDWFLTGTEFCKPSINCGKWHLFIPINNTYLIMYAFDTQSQLTAGFHITPDFSHIFYSFSNHFQRSVYEYTWKQSKLQKNRFVDFNYIYTMYSDEQSSVSYWFYTGKCRDIRVYSAFAKVFEHLRIFALLFLHD